jgi:hypothetical protein
VSPDTGRLSEDNDRELARLVRQIHERAEAKRQQQDDDGEGGEDGG